MPPTMNSVLADLNDRQALAVTHAEGPLLVAAGPGTGKTKVITHRLAARVLGDGVASERLLAITFTNRAAEEMKSRVRALIGGERAIRVGTFHWACHAILRRHGNTGGIPPSFRLLTPSEARVVIRSVGEGLAAAERARLPAAISALKNGAAPDVAARRNRLEPGLIVEVSAAYRRRLDSIGALDLDDLLVRSVDLLTAYPEILQRCRGAHDEILIDEYQDTNPVQQALVQLLTPASRAVVAVGDEDQAIYGWRQADSLGFRRFLAAFPDAKVVRLERSYRSTKRILRAASSLIKNNPERVGIELKTLNDAGEKPTCFVADDERDEADWVATEIAAARDRGLDLRQVAVLYRINAQSRVLEDALIRRGLPYRIVGSQRFYDRPAVQQVVAHLRLAHGDDDHAAAFLARGVPGIGERRLERLRERARDERTSLVEALAGAVPGVSQDGAGMLRAIVENVVALRAMRADSLVRVVDAAIARVSEQIQNGLGIEQESAADDLAELRSVVVEMGPRTTLPDLLDRVSLAGDDTPATGVPLMTLHASKGLEYDVVFLVGLEEGLLPHRRSLDREEDIQEERRLAYVGMTRARRTLHLSYAHSRLWGGVQSLGEPSRFVSEIGHRQLSQLLSARRRLKPRLASVTVGERVMHPRWQRGVVTKVEGTGRQTLATVRFESGERRLQLCHAPLTKLGSDQSDGLAG